MTIGINASAHPDVDVLATGIRRGIDQRTTPAATTATVAARP
jgi:hypothetical protein